MKKPTQKQLAEVFLYAFPAYWSLVLIIIALAAWKESPAAPWLLALEGMCGGMILAGVLLAKGRAWAALPMLLLGVYICAAFGADQHGGQVFWLYGAYLALHYAVCGVCVMAKKRRQ